jgi:tRNA-2-methylthio-N6-dimethylallyladenosine synthase
MNKGETKKLYIKTWGCQMNVYDSRRMADILTPLGYAPVDAPDDADMVILNTCHIREKATEKVFSELGRLKEIKDDRTAMGKKTILAVAGCVAQAEGDIILQRAKSVDLVFGPQTYHQLPEMLIKAGVERQVYTDMAVDEKFDSLPHTTTNKGPAAFLSVQEGCDKFCTFCVVPYTRGAEYSRPVQAVMDEAQRLADTGVKEISLLGQNVNAYHGTGLDGTTWNLARLIAQVAQISGIERIRYTTSHPNDMDQDLIDAHGQIEKLMPYFHLPVQSGSNRILKLMNRKHTAETYLDILSRVRAVRPDIALSSDFIVGFPGETDEDFEDTINLVKAVGYQSSYSFKYSARPGTPAANMQGLVPEKVKTERLMRLQAILNDQALDFNTKTIGLTVPVLFEQESNARAGWLHGRTPYNQSLSAPANPRLIGQIVDVIVKNASPNGVQGQIVTVENLAIPA